MKNKEISFERRKFLGWLTLLTVSVSAGIPFLTKKKQKTQTIKMLTRDGKLVEVDASLIRKTGIKVSNTELQEWVKK
jgi:hypothetical protein